MLIICFIATPLVSSLMYISARSLVMPLTLLQGPHYALKFTSHLQLKTLLSVLLDCKYCSNLSCFMVTSMIQRRLVFCFSIFLWFQGAPCLSLESQAITLAVNLTLSERQSKWKCFPERSKTNKFYVMQVCFDDVLPFVIGFSLSSAWSEYF